MFRGRRPFQDVPVLRLTADKLSAEVAEPRAGAGESDCSKRRRSLPRQLSGED